MEDISDWKKAGDIMYATLNICDNGYNFMCPTLNPVYQQVAFMKQFRLPYYRIIVILLWY
jgi:hypothetical protein